VDIEAFEQMMRAAAARFPGKEWFSTLDYHQAMAVITEAGFTFRPCWELVDRLREAFDKTTNPVGLVIAIDEVYYWYFGRGYVGPERKPEVATAA
jgi:hypothetical protein